MVKGIHAFQDSLAIQMCPQHQRADILYIATAKNKNMGMAALVQVSGPAIPVSCLQVWLYAAA